MKRISLTRDVADLDTYGPQISAAKRKLKAAGYTVKRSQWNYSQYDVSRGNWELQLTWSELLNLAGKLEGQVVA